MTRRPTFWLLFVAVTALATWMAARHFAEAFPLVTVDLKMDRAGAFASARALAEQHGWGPADCRQAAEFYEDSSLQAFVELEGGGNDAYARLLKEGLYHPYRWHVRHFRPGETNETLVRFTPAGEPYGFWEKIPEDRPGPALGSDAARRIAEAGAAAWPVDLSAFALVEASHDVRPSKRVDHTFVYERPNLTLGEGRYRLRLVVSGDRLTELTHFVKIPEAFGRRFQDMRAANEAIATAASIGAIALFALGGCVVGLFVLLRQRRVIWKQPLFWGGLVAFGYFLAQLNTWPLSWMRYDTATPAASFATQQIVQLLATVFGMAGLAILVVMGAESLTRRAFPRHIQLWRIWRPEVAASPAVLGRTLAAYLLVGLLFAYEVGLYLFGRNVLGWWMPSGLVFQPDILAAYLPFFYPVSISFWAGLAEECFFRAAPLAAAALIGKRLGGQRLWILGALILQAAVFGAAHANYPAQPAYARLVELMPAFLLVGVVYLWLGLLPVIVMHFTFDVVWFAMPLFASSAPGVWVQQVLIVALTLVPLWVVLFARWRRGRWADVDESARNAAWVPPPAPERPSTAAPAAASPGIGPRARQLLLVAGVLGLGAWIAATDFRSEVPPLTASSADARSAARLFLQQRGIALDATWRESARVDAGVDAVDRFVWQEGGPAVYRELLGTYLWKPRWRVRYARFEGDVAERAEEYLVWTDETGRICRFRHVLPEARAGASLDEHAARALARATVKGLHGLDPAALEEVSADPEQQPARRDWDFVFKNPAVTPGPGGEARIAVGIAGDEVVDSYLFVFVPEEWERAETARQTSAGSIGTGATIVLVLLFIGGCVLGIVRWSRHRFATRAFLVFAATFAALRTATLLNVWPVLQSGFQTDRPFLLQAALALGAGTFGALVIAAAIALSVGLIHRWLPPQPTPGRGAGLAAAGLGCALAGVAAIVSALAPRSLPTWANTQVAGALVPLGVIVTSPIVDWMMHTTLLLLLLGLVHAATRGWSRRRVPFGALLVLAGLVLAGTRGVDTAGSWLIAGLVGGALLLGAYVLVLRRQLALVPVMAAAPSALDILRTGLLRGIPVWLPGAILVAALLLLLGFLWFVRLSRDSGPPPAESEAPEAEAPAAEAQA